MPHSDDLLRVEIQQRPPRFRAIIIALLARIEDAERRLAERDAAGYETPSDARTHIARARTEWESILRDEAQHHSTYYEAIITRDLDHFDVALIAQHAADVGPVEYEEPPQC